jgi:hypothetical protein
MTTGKELDSHLVIIMNIIRLHIALWEMKLNMYTKAFIMDVAALHFAV